MRCPILTLLLAFFSQAHEWEVGAKHAANTQDSADRLVDNLTRNDILDQRLVAQFSFRIDLEDTLLAKPSHLTIHRSPVVPEARITLVPHFRQAPPKYISRASSKAKEDAFYKVLEQRDDAAKKKAMELFDAARKSYGSKELEALIEYETIWGHTTLMQACMQKNVELVKMMIAAGADVNAMSEEGERVLNWAIDGASSKPPDDPEEQIIKLLIEAGASLGRGFGSYPERIEPYRKAKLAAKQPDGAGHSEEGQIQGVHSEEDFDTYVQQSPGLVVLNVGTTWCGPCKLFAPKYKLMAAEYKKVTFLKVNADENESTKRLVSRFNVKTVPSFFFLRNGEVVANMKGTKEDQFRSTLSEFMVAEEMPEQKDLSEKTESSPAALIDKELTEIVFSNLSLL